MSNVVPINKNAGRLGELEHIIEANKKDLDRAQKTFVEVGSALKEIRDSKLYQDDYRSFNAYCQDRWGFNRAYADRLIKCATMYSNLDPTGSIIPHTSTPKNEWQARRMQKERRAAAKPAPSTPPPAPSAPRLTQADIGIEDPEEEQNVAPSKRPAKWDAEAFLERMRDDVFAWVREWQKRKEKTDDLLYAIRETLEQYEGVDT
jgi:hypothetical protein